MNCLEFHRRLGSEPASTHAAFVAHREACPRCASAQRAAIEFEERIRGALHIPVSTHLVDRIILAQTTEVRRQVRNRKRGFGALIMAAAASILIAVVAIQSAQPPVPALAELVIEHLHKHVVSAPESQSVIPKQDVMAAFGARGVNLATVPDGINYVHECRAGPYKTVHMVMPERDGMVSVVYVVDKSSLKAIDFVHDGMHGREIPLGNGSLVMLAQHDENFDTIESHWKRAIGETVASRESRFPGTDRLQKSWRPLINKTMIAAP